MPHTIETFLGDPQRSNLRVVNVSHSNGEGGFIYRCAITHIDNEGDDAVPELGANEILGLFMHKIKNVLSGHLDWLPVGIGETPSEALESMMEQINACYLYESVYRAVIWNASYYYSKCVQKWGYLTANMYFIFPMYEEITECTDIHELFSGIYKEVDGLSKHHRLAVRYVAIREEAEKEKLIDQILGEEKKIKPVGVGHEQQFIEKLTGITRDFLVGVVKERVEQMTYPVMLPGESHSLFITGFLVPNRPKQDLDVERLKILYNASRANTSTMWFPVAADWATQAVFTAIGKNLQHNLLPIDYVRDLVWIAANVLETLLKDNDVEKVKKIFRIPTAAEVMENKDLLFRNVDHHYTELTQLFLPK